MAFLRLDRWAVFKRAVFDFPLEQATVQHGYVIVAEDLEDPPTRAAENRPTLS